MFDFRVKNSAALHRTFNVQPLYLQHENSGNLQIINLHALNTATFAIKNVYFQALQLITWYNIKK